MTIQPRGFDFLKDVDVRLSVELGRTDMKLKDVLALGEESVVVLDRLTDELLDVMVNGKPIAKGEIVAQGNRFGLRIVELAGAKNRLLHVRQKPLAEQFAQAPLGARTPSAPLRRGGVRAEPHAEQPAQRVAMPIPLTLVGEVDVQRRSGPIDGFDSVQLVHRAGGQDAPGIELDGQLAVLVEGGVDRTGNL